MLQTFFSYPIANQYFYVIIFVIKSGQKPKTIKNLPNSLKIRPLTRCKIKVQNFLKRNSPDQTNIRHNYIIEVDAQNH